MDSVLLAQRGLWAQSFGSTEQWRHLAVSWGWVTWAGISLYIITISCSSLAADATWARVWFFPPPPHQLKLIHISGNQTCSCKRVLWKMRTYSVNTGPIEITSSDHFNPAYCRRGSAEFNVSVTVDLIWVLIKWSVPVQWLSLIDQIYAHEPLMLVLMARGYGGIMLMLPLLSWKKRKKHSLSEWARERNWQFSLHFTCV